MRRLTCALTTALLLIGCDDEAAPSPKSDEQLAEPPTPKTPAAPLTATTVNQFFQAGTPTFVVGTKGDATADHRIATQAGLVRGLIAPDAKIVLDVDVDPNAWPERSLVYGGSDVNALIAGLKLPFRVDRDKIVIGDATFEGEGHRLIAVVPRTAQHPDFVIFAGTGAAGIAEVNAFIPMGNPIVVADGFGALVTGSWRQAGDKLEAELGPRRRRIEYRTVDYKLRGASIAFKFPVMVPAADKDGAMLDACMRGLATVVDKLEITEPVSMSIYVYPDRKSKQQLTGNGGDGHAVPSSRTLHVLASDPKAIEHLVAHEATHVLGYYALGPAGTPMMGEGMAVWVSGSYGGKSLAKWRTDLEHIPFAKLVDQRWRELPEQQKYPLAALAFEAAVAEVGLAKVGEHLLGATVESWDDACVAAGTNSGTLEERVKLQLKR